MTRIQTIRLHGPETGRNRNRTEMPVVPRKLTKKPIRRGVPLSKTEKLPMKKWIRKMARAALDAALEMITVNYLASLTKLPVLIVDLMTLRLDRKGKMRLAMGAGLAAMAIAVLKSGRKRLFGSFLDTFRLMARGTGETLSMTKSVPSSTTLKSLTSLPLLSDSPLKAKSSGDTRQ